MRILSSSNLYFLAQPIEDRLFKIWVTSFHSRGTPLPETVPHEYQSILQLKAAITTACSPSDLRYFDFDLLCEELSQGCRYYAGIPRALAVDLGFQVDNEDEPVESDNSFRLFQKLGSV